MNNLQAILNVPVKAEAVSTSTTTDAATSSDGTSAPQEPFQEVLKQQIGDAKAPPHAKDLAIALGELAALGDDTELKPDHAKDAALQDAAQLLAWFHPVPPQQPLPEEHRVIDTASVTALLQTPTTKTPVDTSKQENIDTTQLAIGKDDPKLKHDLPVQQTETTTKAASTQTQGALIARITERAADPSAKDAELAAGQAGAQSMRAAVQAPAPNAAAPALQVNTLLGQAGWTEEVGQKLTLMIGAKQHVAELHIVPPQLGPIDIKITVDGNQTTAVFTSPHSEVRQTLEASLPRLREVLADSGITLGNASVTADSPRDGSAFAASQQQQGSRGGVDLAPDQAPESIAVRTVALPRPRGAVDLFA